MDSSGVRATEQKDARGDLSSVTWLLFQKDVDTRVPVETIVKGEIPDWLNGTLYRNGCGLFEENENGSSHLFEGYAVLHRFDVKSGRVTYTSRVLHPEAWLRAVKAHRLAVAEDGVTKEYPDPCMTTFSGTATYFKNQRKSDDENDVVDDLEDRTGVNIVKHGDKLFALTESPVLQEVDPDSLIRISKIDLKKILSVHMSTAHPHVDRDGTLYNLATSFAPPNNYNIIKMPLKSLDSEEDMQRKVKLVASVQARWNFGISYSHSFGMSEKFFIILEQPATLSSLKIFGEGTTFKPSSVFRKFDLHPQEKIRFYLIDRRQGNQVLSTQYLGNACFTFHFINCYDDGESVVVDLASYDDINIINDLNVSNATHGGRDVCPCMVRRYVLPLNINKVPVGHNLQPLAYTTARAKVTSPGVVHLTPDFICKSKDRIYIELPRINYELVAGKKYRFIYGTSLLTSKQRLIKLDLHTRTPLFWTEEDCDPGEPVFVPRPGGMEEDDGVILSPVISLTGLKPCFLLIMDARSFTEVARATTPHNVKVAMTFHGNFYPHKS